MRSLSEAPAPEQDDTRWPPSHSNHALFGAITPLHDASSSKTSIVLAAQCARTLPSSAPGTKNVRPLILVTPFDFCVRPSIFVYALRFFCTPFDLVFVRPSIWFLYALRFGVYALRCLGTPFIAVHVAAPPAPPPSRDVHVRRLPQADCGQ